MYIVREYLVAIVSMKEFNEGVGATYPDLYIIDDHQNYYKRVKLAAGGEAILQVKELPTPKVAPAKLLEEKVSFLPGGKIPQIYINQIASFFKSVMDVNFGGGKTGAGDESEAMAHILWSKSKQQYSINIPKQEVSKGSVKYDFDYLKLEDGSLNRDLVIIVDVH